MGGCDRTGCLYRYWLPRRGRYWRHCFEADELEGMEERASRRDLEETSVICSLITETASQNCILFETELSLTPTVVVLVV